jgi:hypothetical protein
MQSELGGFTPKDIYLQFVASISQNRWGANAQGIHALFSYLIIFLIVCT